ncbi:DEAD/DEAH box helicase [Hazenella sp. IB182357]|uniref:DEAD/DEAH box helicase n=1 Tax=Polycladospora coralii TaxID=2771432 RepID=A0A926RWM6_9BACL|nr:SNF2-related protein [Polycladospora coralii]MBD1371671.1 DEAD/DEAH box helicase [Polycladospora coralii]
MKSIPIRMNRTWISELQNRVEQDTLWSSWEAFQLAIEAAEAESIPSFDSLVCLKQLYGFEPLPHQIEVAKKVIHQMRGRAILADEVGLGKTIEAGLVLKEYLLRGLVKNALILVPSSLVLQWTRELSQKFQIPAMAQKKEWMWDKYDFLVASIDTAKREPHRAHILNKHYDMIIVDEAHKLKNRKTQNWQFINQVKKKYLLLLTATPVQNEMSELFNLVTLLKPGQLGKQNDFKQEYVAGKRLAKNEEQLRKEVHRVLIRNKRRDGDIHLTKRMVKTIPITLSAPERALYNGISQFIRTRYHQEKDLKNMLSLLVLQKEVCSSRDAVFHTLFKLFQQHEKNSQYLSPEVAHLTHLLKQVTSSSKVKTAIQLIQELSPEKVVLFTEYRATQEMIVRELAQVGIYAVPFRGGFKRNKKDWMMELFKMRAQVLVATEAGGEGINLQFCHHMINFDMPWNPMKVEQRIGRIHRFGQKEDVRIYNFATMDTIEEHIIWLLHEKIQLFETVIGELETILVKVEKKHSFEQSVMEMMLQSENDTEIRQRMKQWSDDFQDAKALVTAEMKQQDVLLNGSIKS